MSNTTNENIARLQRGSYPFTVRGEQFLSIGSARIKADTLAEKTGEDVAILERGSVRYTVRPGGSVY